MSYTNSTIRCFLCGVNILFLITGLLVLSLGLALKIIYYSYGQLVSLQYIYFPNILIALGTLIFILSYIGCHGIARENSILTLIYSSLLLLIFFLELGIGTSGFILKTRAEDLLIHSLTNTISDYEKSADISYSWDVIQEQFHCCGIYEANDWVKDKINSIDLPASCCQNETIKFDKYSTNCTLGSNYAHKSGCLNIFGDFIRTNSFAIQVTGFALAFFQIFCFCCSCYLFQEFQKGYAPI